MLVGSPDNLLHVGILPFHQAGDQLASLQVELVRLRGAPEQVEKAIHHIRRECVDTGELVFVGGVPDGIMLATACPTPFVLPGDSACQLPTFLWVTPFTLAETRRASPSTPVLLYANGDGTFQIFNSGGLMGVFGWQFLVGDGAGVLLGSTNVASF